MENVVAFNNELSGLYDSKPPISKAKMAAITKSAMRAIKFYKHVVQSVEKFILKCKPEYKVPGLYVIDSIVRQSRHQFGPEKDVFAPRFARNIKETFANLFRCAPEDKSRIIRVLNLWQKNNVFAPEVIQPIFDFADPNHPIYQLPPGGMSSSSGPGGSSGMGDISTNTSNGLNVSSSTMDTSMSGVNATGMTVNSAEDKHGGMPDLSSMTHEKAQSVLDSSTLRQLEHMQQYLKRQAASSTTTTAKSTRGGESHDRNHGAVSNYACLLDGGSGSAGSGGGNGSGGGIGPGTNQKSQNSESYTKYTKSSHELTYEDDESAEDNSPQHTSKLLDNNNLQQLLNDPNVLRQLQTLQNFQKIKQQEEQQYKFNEMRMQEDTSFDKHWQSVLKGSAAPSGANDSIEFVKEVEFVSEEQKIEVINLDANDSRSPSPERDRYKSRRRSRSRSRSRDRGRRRRSRSRSRTRSPRSSYRRRSSRDRDRNDRTGRDKERDREHERERRKKGLPDIRKEHLSVCSTTLWVGHLSKLVYQEELSDTFGAYGDIVSIDLIVPRGCAFIVMNRRQDANKAMQSLKNHKLQGRVITISWAAGKGVKSKEWKDFWDLELGVTYIPWNKLDESTDFDSLEEGGMFDEDSMPGWMKDKINHMKSLKEKMNENHMNPANSMIFGIDTTQPPPGPPPTGAPPPLLPLVPGQFPLAPPMSGPPPMAGPPPMGGVSPMSGPPQLGGTRMMAQMGMSLSGIPMPPNLVPGIPPPHPMMMPTGMMPPGFPPIPSGGPPVGGHIGLPSGHHQFPPQQGAGPVIAPPPTGANLSNDDQMDIEMDDEETPSSMSSSLVATTSAPTQLNFNQPPPMFGVGPGLTGEGDMFSRDRNRSVGGGAGGGGSRWGGRGGEDGDGDGDGLHRWRENGNMSGPNFNEGGVRGNGGRGGPMNIPPLDINNPPQRPDFLNDFDNRGPRGGGGGGQRGNHNGEFFPNMQNRFNQPTSLMQMRIAPPNAFNPRMGGPGGPSGPLLFMRGGQGGGTGPVGRQGFYNPRNPFDRDISGGGGRGGRGGRGGGRGGHGFGPSGPNNWSDDEGDEGNNFKRRGGPIGVGGNRFRDRDGSEDRYNRDRNTSGNRRGLGERGGGHLGSRDRQNREQRDNERDWERGTARVGSGNRRGSRDETGGMLANEVQPQAPLLMTNTVSDTEDDWDQELVEYDGKFNTTQTSAAKAPAPTNLKPSLSIETKNDTTSKRMNQNTVSHGDFPTNDEISGKSDKDNIFSGPSLDIFTNDEKSENQDEQIMQRQSAISQNENKREQVCTENTPLYDELPPATITPPKHETASAENFQTSISENFPSAGPVPTIVPTTKNDETVEVTPLVESTDQPTVVATPVTEGEKTD